VPCRCDGRPAAGALLALEQFLTSPLDAPFAGLGLFGIFDPADELVPPERRQLLPEREQCTVTFDRPA
jgi:hypothetical protein